MGPKRGFLLGVVGLTLVVEIQLLLDVISDKVKGPPVKLLLFALAISLFYFAYLGNHWGLARISPSTFAQISAAVRRSFRRPLWGYKRLQVILCLMLWGVVLGNLLWTYDWSGTRPPYINLKPTSEDLKLYRLIAGLQSPPSEAFRPISPAKDTTIPYPLALEVIKDNNSFLKEISKYNLPQSRGLICRNPMAPPAEKPCHLVLSVPLSITYSFYEQTEKSNSSETNGSFPVAVDTFIKKPRITMEWIGDQISIGKYPDSPDENGMGIFEVSIPDLVSWDRTSVEPELLFRAAAGRSISKVSARISEKELEKAVQRKCKIFKTPFQKCPVKEAEDLPCNVRTSSTSSVHCTATRTTGAYKVIGNISSRTETNYPLDRVEDRAFFVLFANYLGHEIEYRPDEAAFLKGLADEIRNDYAIIMGAPQAGDKAMDRSAIRQALIRQIQLYPYYEDREEWRTIIMEDLETKLRKMGFPVEYILPERTP